MTEPSESRRASIAGKARIDKIQRLGAGRSANAPCADRIIFSASNETENCNPNRLGLTLKRIDARAIRSAAIAA
ncbi:hypothetical protein ACNHKD_05760 [Methylocystis sp. JAN1]|uniref:hypothetical protein n=1 Tax=Methylocystis sp. JAN1 TaxID=3397211 RepID=UPI003FA23579